MTNLDTITVLGVVGLKQSGKDTIANYLVKEYGFTRYAFADPIKKACQIIFGFTDEQCWGGEKEDIDDFWEVKPRTIFQVFGTELFQYELPKYVPKFKKFGRAFWAQCFLKWYEEELEKNPNLKVVIPDTRFPFEADIIRGLDGTIIKVVRPSVMETHNDLHPSETEMQNIKVDYTFDNNTNIVNLETKLDIWLKSEVPFSEIMLKYY